MVAGKLGFMFFLPKNLFFNTFLTQNTLEIMINLFMVLNNRPKNQTQLETKNKPNLKSVFFFTNF